jgi:hypothetical protein
MTRRYRRRRGRPKVVDALLSAVVIGAVLYGTLAAFTTVKGNAAAFAAVFVTGVVVGYSLPSVRVRKRL